MTVTSEEQKIVALLQDVVEDTEWTIENLQSEGFSENVVDALKLLTHDDGSPYEEFIERNAGHALAKPMKRADLTSNMDIKRIPEPSEKDFARLQKPHRAWRRLTNEC